VAEEKEGVCSIIRIKEKSFVLELGIELVSTDCQAILLILGFSSFSSTS